MDPCNGNDEFETKPDTACGLDYDALWWFSVGICKYEPGYKSHDLL